MSNLPLLIVLGAFGSLLILDVLAPARRFPRVHRWRLRGVVAFAMYLMIATTLPLHTDAWLGQYQLLDATGLGTIGGAILGVLVLTLGVYLWHRALHASSFLWRWFHQVHHSAERIDVAGAFYFSPLDMVGFTLVGSVTLVLGIGVTAEAAVITSVVTTLLGMFQHANLRTPQWLGWIVQRPENHAVHHERGAHACNYGDLALWDLLFGTWRNPARWDGVGGFFDGSTDRLADMLRGRDLTVR